MAAKSSPSPCLLRGQGGADGAAGEVGNAAMRHAMAQDQRRRAHLRRGRSAAPAIDRNYALSLIGSNEDALDHITSIFVEEAARVWVKLESGMAERNQDLARRAAHSLKGSAATIGALALSREADQLERALKEENWEEAVRLVPVVQTRSGTGAGIDAGIITNNQRVKALFRYVEAIAVTSRPVLITGETGTGKELMARSVHQLSGRKGPFVSVNISGLDDTLFSDMLFGHIRGAFTGADRDHAGLIERASGGTLFLDEIGDLSMPSQIKLLRLLQEGEYFPLGTNTPKKSDARIVVATLRDLEAAQKTAEFRGDLYYRLQTHRVHMPPLRERLDDLPILVSHFLSVAAKDLNKIQPTPPSGIIDLLASYTFPGNIRELESMVFDAVSNHRGKVMSLEVFKAHIARNRILSGGLLLGDTPLMHVMDERGLFESLGALPTIRNCTETLITEALRRANNNQAVAASLLGIAPSSLNKRLKRSSQKMEPDTAAL